MARGRDWSEREIEATVGDYFAMLRLELAAEAYSKTAFRRRLLPKLDRRNDAAVEFKRQNISAVLISLGFPYIAGYKPAFNFQRALVVAVRRQLERETALQSMVAAQTSAQPAAEPPRDILGALVPPPRLAETASQAAMGVREHVGAAPTDYFAIEAANRALGMAGEKFVLEYEIARLTACRQEKLACSVVHTSASHGDGAGYDILSFEESGKERLIEVKTTLYGPHAPFYVSRNELEVSHERADIYCLYRLYAFERQARFFMKRGPLDREFRLRPQTWTACLPPT